MAQRDVTKYITNPLNAYILIKRTSAELKLLEKYLTPGLKEEFQKLWQYKEDIVGATEGLFRLQVTYRISSLDFSNGVVMGKKVRKPLSAHDLFTIGTQALDLLVEWQYPRSEDFFAIEYLQMALNKIANGEDPDEEVDRELLVLTLSEVYGRTGQYKNAADVAEFLSKKDKKFEDLKTKYMDMLDTFGLSKVYVENPYNEEINPIKRFNWKTDDIYTNQACRGERVLSIQEQSKLRCRYISNSPFSKIAPFRVEELYQNPLVHLYYNVIFDNEIEVVKNISGAKLQRGRNYLGGDKEGYTNRRITKTAFCWDNEDNVFEKLAKRVTVRILNRKT